METERLVEVDDELYACSWGKLEDPPEGSGEYCWCITPTPTAEHSRKLAIILSKLT